MDHLFTLGLPGPSGNENDTYIGEKYVYKVWPILQQPRIANARPATQVMIDTYMAAIGFQKHEEAGRYINSNYEVWDLLPRNVLADKDGDIYVIDAEIKQLKQ